VAWSFSFFIHHRTDDGRGIAVFVCCPMPVPERSGQKWQFTSKVNNIIRQTVLNVHADIKIA